MTTQDLGSAIPVRAGWAEDAVREAETESPHGGAEDLLAGSSVGREHLTREQQVMERIDRARARKARVKEPRITLSHGAGGKATHNLIDAIFLDAFRNPELERMSDAASLVVGDTRLAFTTDSYVVSPLFFPGGDIGDLAVNGTVNDLAMAGARPLVISCGFILEEGFPTDDLRRVVASMAAAAKAAGVQIVTGDTKVVQRGKGDGCYINTSGIGVRERPIELNAANASPATRSWCPGRSATTG